MNRCLLLLSWSNSSISPLAYLFLLSKIDNFCGLCLKKDRLSTYDSLTSYYNRIGDRFHDIGKWDQIKKENCKDIKLKEIPSPYSNQQSHSIENSIFVKEISNNKTDSSSSLSSITNHHLSNGLIVTNHKHSHF